VENNFTASKGFYLLLGGTLLKAHPLWFAPRHSTSILQGPDDGSTRLWNPTPTSRGPLGMPVPGLDNLTGGWILAEHTSGGKRNFSCGPGPPTEDSQLFHRPANTTK